MRRGAKLGATVVVALQAGWLPAASADAIYEYKLLNHPDGNQAPPTYGLRLDGIEGFVQDGVGTSDSNTWTFDFTSMAATYTHTTAANDDDTFRIYGTAVGGKDTSGSGYDGGFSVSVSIDFTFTGFEGNDSYFDPEIHVNGTAKTVSNNGTGSIVFNDSIFGIAKDTTVLLKGFANASGNVFNFDADPPAGHRLSGYCGGVMPPSYCGMPVGWGWLALVDDTGAFYHTASQDFLFVDPTPIPEPSSLALFVPALGGLMFAVGFVARRQNSAASKSEV